MNILILTDYYPPDKLGGVGEIAKNLKHTYEAKGHKTWVLTTGDSKSEDTVVRSSRNLIKGVFLNNLLALKLIRKGKFDLIHMHQSTTTFFLIAKHLPYFRKKFPHVINSFQVSYFSEFSHIKSVKIRGRTFRPATKEYIEKWLLAPVHILLDLVGYIFSDVVTVVSSENKKEFSKTYGRISKKRIYIVPNGVDIDAFTPKKPALNTKFLKKLEGKTVLLYVGVFRVRKRVFNLLYALKKVQMKNNNVMLVLVGGGRDYEEDILALIQSMGLQDNVVFVGKVPNHEIVDYLNASNVFCLLSSYEGMPVAILEAMATSKAILTSNVSGMVDLVTDGETGYLTDVDDIGQISSKLQLLVNSPKKAKDMGHASRRRVVDAYTWSNIADTYLRLVK